MRRYVQSAQRIECQQLHLASTSANCPLLKIMSNCFHDGIVVPEPGNIYMRGGFIPKKCFGGGAPVGIGNCQLITKYPHAQRVNVPQTP